MIGFSSARLPRLLFGSGSFIASLESVLHGAGIRRLAIFTGRGSFLRSPSYDELITLLERLGIEFESFRIPGEPSPELVDDAASSLRGRPPDAVLAVGGGSVIDAGKAVAAMVPTEGSVEEFLEGVGTRGPDGRKVFMIACPTTAGTGSEATKNAVISRTGPGGFKKSLRHDNYVPDVAILDPELALTCPPSVTAASGLDAVTQLLEAFVSTGANPLTDALAVSGLAYAGGSFLRAVERGDDLDAREGMAYAAYLSGVCLANAGLGVVHGVASPAGALRDIPHGVVCGTLLAGSVALTAAKIGAGAGAGTHSENQTARKYAEAARLLSGEDRGTDAANIELLVETLERWTERSGIPRLGSFGLTEQDARAIAALTSAKNHPITLTVDEIADLILSRL
jgi:alcohol dehydrogenase class IV